MAHLELRRFVAGSQSSRAVLTYLKFEKSRGVAPTDASNHFALNPNRTRTRLTSYPEGNFGGNQLLEEDGSISPSPYTSSQTNDMPSDIAAASTQVSSGLRPAQHIVSPSFRVPTRHAHNSKPFSEDQVVRGHPLGDPANQLPSPCGFTHPFDSTQSDSLVLVFQYGQWVPHRARSAQVPQKARS
ncbi:hypothetical protein Tco_0453606 [Tanacetum coccineum]